jgi:hypothetical protein
MDAFSLATAAEIFSSFPEWRSLAREERDDQGDAFLVIEVPAPVGADVEHGLVLDTAREEVTVAFDCYHTHFDSWLEGNEPYEAGSALDFVNGILEERVAVLSWWSGHQWRGSSQMPAGACLHSPSGISRFDRVRIRSWNGTLNADMEISQERQASDHELPMSHPTAVPPPSRPER